MCYIALSEKRPSSVSSMLSTMSISSNYSAVSGEAAAVFGDVSASSADAAAGSYDGNNSGDSAVDGSPRSQVVREIVRNEIELVVVSHLNSPSDFYVQLNTNLNVFNMVNSELDRHMKSEHGAVPVGHVEIGELTL